MTITYGSVCSGIEAASVAWADLDMKAAWFSQFDPEHNYSRGPDFPSAVLAKHWPDVENLGDMTKIADRVMAGEVAAPDVVVGGTPCQAFSVAGSRAGLSDARGQLTLSYVELANAIDRKRAAKGKSPAVFIWENVPGVLSSKDNAFGCFLGALSGEDDQLIAPGKKWSNAGCVFGPQRTISWVIKDAQYFGVAQRRRRVFVVASADPRVDTTEILFESESVRRDTPPSREPRAQVAALTANGVGTCGADDNQAQAGHLIAFGGGNTGGSIDVASACTAHGVRMDFDTETFCLQHAQIGRKDDAGPQGKGYQAGIAYTLDSRTAADAVAFNWQAGGNTSADLGMSEHYTGAIAASQHPAVCFRSNGHASFSEGVNPLRAKPGSDHETLVVTLRGREGGATAELGENISGTLRASSGGGDKQHILNQYQVRRLMPVECERLQGFPDGHTDIGADGPRYKAIGNSMAVPVMKWIGERVMMQLSKLDVLPVKTAGDYGGSNTPVDIRDLWQTPPQIYNALNEEFHFSVDLAASSVNRLHENYVTAEMDTLKINWVGMFGHAWGWMNPPYSDIGLFVRKVAEQQAEGFGTVMLVPADTSVGWFTEALAVVSEVRLITGGRLSFIRADTGKPVNGNNKGSMLLIFRSGEVGAARITTVERDTLMAPL